MFTLDDVIKTRLLGKGEGGGSGGGDEQSLLDSLIDRSITEITSNATSIGSQVLRDCSALTSVDFPVATSIGGTAFYNCYELTSVVFPCVTNIGATAFSNCIKLTSVDFPCATSIATNAFSNCNRLVTIILRSDTICTMSHTNVLQNCYHFHGTSDTPQDGYIYVPKSLIEDYKVALNWSTFATQFRALEDYTVDGTTTGALDESKI